MRRTQVLYLEDFFSEIPDESRRSDRQTKTVRYFFLRTRKLFYQVLGRFVLPDTWKTELGIFFREEAVERIIQEQPEYIVTYLIYSRILPNWISRKALKPLQEKGFTHPDCWAPGGESHPAGHSPFKKSASTIPYGLKYMIREANNMWRATKAKDKKKGDSGRSENRANVPKQVFCKSASDSEGMA